MQTIIHIMSKVIFPKFGHKTKKYLNLNLGIVVLIFEPTFDGVYCSVKQKPFIKDRDSSLKLTLKDDGDIARCHEAVRSDIWKGLTLENIDTNCEIHDDANNILKKLFASLSFHVIHLLRWYKLCSGHQTAQKTIDYQ